MQKIQGYTKRVSSDCFVYCPGRMLFNTAWKIQENIASKIAVGEHPPALLLLEHPHTFTLGRRGQIKNLLWSRDQLARKKVEVVRVDRGGDITYHGPGQLVGYPILPLAPITWKSEKAEHIPGDLCFKVPQVDYVGYIRKLELILNQTLSSFHIHSYLLDGLTGIWVNAEGKTKQSTSSFEGNQKHAKIASIGVKVDAQGITRHGFALNINPDMEYWKGIIACGLIGYPTASMSELLDQPPDFWNVIQEVVAAFSDKFNFHIKMIGSSSKHWRDLLA